MVILLYRLIILFLQSITNICIDVYMCIYITISLYIQIYRRELVVKNSRLFFTKIIC